MRHLISYINGLNRAQRASFMQRCGTTEAYLRKAASAGQRLGEALCINIDRESGGQVTCESLRPDVDWGYLRGAVPPESPEHGS